jgi:hypothetical protein
MLFSSFKPKEEVDADHSGCGVNKKKSPTNYFAKASALFQPLQDVIDDLSSSCLQSGRAFCDGIPDPKITR